MKNDNGRKSDLKPFVFLKRIPTLNATVSVSLCAMVAAVALWAVWMSLRLHLKTLLFAVVAVGGSFLLLAFLLIREQKKSKRLETFLSMMTQTTGGCYWEGNPSTKKLHLTPRGLSLFGRDVNNFDDFAALVHPDDLNQFRKAEQKALLPGEKLNVEFRIQSARGNWHWFVMRSNAVERASDGTVNRVLGSMVDIDEHRRAVEAMRASERRLATIFRSAPGSMAVTDEEGRLIDANQAFYDMLGYGADELQGVPILSLSETPRDKENRVVMAEILKECESYEDRRFHLEENFVCRDGRRITLDFGLSAILDYDGNVQNYIFSGIDITQQKKHAAELKLLAENQRWLFDFLRRFNQFEGMEQLFHALKENLPNVVCFTSLKLVVPSFLGKAWVLDNATGLENDEKRTGEEIAALLSGTGPLGRSYVARTAIAWGDLARGEESDSRIRSVLAVPLVYKETTWGVMGLESEDARAFTDQDVTLMSIVGSNIGLYFEEQSNRTELDIHTQRLQQLHTLIHTLLRTRNRDHLLEGMLGYLKSIVPDSACAVYLFTGDRGGGESSLSRLAWYDEENIPVPDSDAVLNAIAHEAPATEFGEGGAEVRRISPIVFQTHNVGAVDLYKPSGLLPSELKLYQLLIDYVAGLWVLYDLMALREEEASVDPLTGIWNRRYMIRRLQEESDRITRYGGNACIVIGDMGNFKHTNDTYGHVKGDEVLVRSAAAIRKNLRFSDSIGRYGGDEFILLLPNVTKGDAVAVIDRIRLELSQIRILGDDSRPDGPLISVVMDFGLALFPGGAATLMDTINLADEAMYANKMARKAQAAKKEATSVETPLKVAEGKQHERKKTHHAKTNDKRGAEKDEKDI